MSTGKKRFSQAEMKRQATADNLRVSANVRKMLSSSENGELDDRALAFQIAKDITVSLRPSNGAATTIQPYSVDVALKLIEYCRTGPEESGNKMSEQAIKELVHKRKTTRVKDGKKTKVQVNASKDAVKVLKLLDAAHIPAFIDMGIKLMEQKKRNTLQGKDVRPLYDNRDKC